MQKWDGEKRTDVEVGMNQSGAQNYPTLVPPVRLLVTTAEGKTFDVKLLAKTGDGELEIEYRPTNVPSKAAWRDTVKRRGEREPVAGRRSSFGSGRVGRSNASSVPRRYEQRV